jgi:hypothetical protein
MMNDYRVGDSILYHAEDFAEARMAVIDQLLPNGCFCSAMFPQYSMPITILVRGEQIICKVQAD